MAKNFGKMFEEDFKKSMPEGVYYQRMKDDTNRFKGVKNICDHLAYRYPYLFLLELKSTKENSLPFDNLKEHQVTGLFKASAIPGVMAGFLFEYRKHQRVYFVFADDVYDYIGESGRKSFPVDWASEVGVFVSRSLKKTRYSYDVDRLLTEVVKANAEKDSKGN